MSTWKKLVSKNTSVKLHTHRAIVSHCLSRHPRRASGFAASFLLPRACSPVFGCFCCCLFSFERRAACSIPGRNHLLYKKYPCAIFGKSWTENVFAKPWSSFSFSRLFFFFFPSFSLFSLFFFFFFEMVQPPNPKVFYEVQSPGCFLDKLNMFEAGEWYSTRKRENPQNCIRYLNTEKIVILVI